uniref:Putative secreted protein n=1 Tax=Anopheles darlingi TaxID=43151 RepID=A0A2M4DEA4_ANODA
MILVRRQLNLFALLQLHLGGTATLDQAGTDLRSLGVERNRQRERFAQLLRVVGNRFADVLDRVGMILVRTVGKVQPCNVHTGRHHLLQHVR